MCIKQSHQQQHRVAAYKLEVLLYGASSVPPFFLTATEKRKKKTKKQVVTLKFTFLLFFF
jgi:hypothetical protein